VVVDGVVDVVVVVEVVEVVVVVGVGSEASHSALWINDVGTRQRVTLCGADGDDGDGGVSLSILVRDSASKAPVKDAAGTEAAAPLPDASPDAFEGGASDVVVVAGVVVNDEVVVVVDGVGDVAYWTVGGVPSNALTIVGSVPVLPRAQNPSPLSPYCAARRAI